MKLSPPWLREFVNPNVDNHRLAQDLTSAGIAVEAISGEGDNAVFEMEITTNRPDAMNHYGVAREASSIYNLPLRPLEANLPAALGTTNFEIEIGDKQGCARYTSRILTDVTIKPSLEHVVQRLASVDQRPINNAADATNYTLWEMGHPTHVFDFDLLQGGKIMVRRAFSGETLKTLDGLERKLSPEDLVIADAVRPIGLAGIMGGFDTMITDNTRNILIEAAWFDPATVRKTAKRLGMHTDASHRFERGADYGATSLACARVAQRILESAGGHLQGEEIDVGERHIDQAPVALHLSEVHRILGKKLNTQEVVGILKRLGFELLPEPGEEPEFTVRIPSWRLDVEREIDLIEEIARLHGYDKFTHTLPAYAGAVTDPPEQGKDEQLRSWLLALGYNEAISLSFVSHEEAEQFSSVPVVELANPISEQATVMRPSLVSGMLNMLMHNLNRGVDDIRLFEAGNVFELAGAKAAELKRICLGATGSVIPASVHQPPRPFCFFDLKGDVEQLLHLFGCSQLCYDAATSDYYHPGRSARAAMDQDTVAQFGQLHPDLATKHKLRQNILIAELYLDRLYKHDLRQVRYQALPRYPAVQRDFSFVFADSVTFEAIDQKVRALGIRERRSFVPLEIFRGGSVPAGKYSILLRATFQSSERTLREDEVTRWSSQIIKALEALGGKLRS